MIKKDIRKKAEERQKESIYVVCQQFYGNRTGLEIDRDKVDYLLDGCLNYSFKKPTTDIKIVHVHGSEHVVIVYDRLQEDEYVNVRLHLVEKWLY
jgi:hypothetical protein